MISFTRPAPAISVPTRAAASSDESLIKRIAGCDKLAMQALYARHHVRVFRFVLGLVHDEGMAEDLISEVFLDVWRQADRFEGRSAVSTWRDLRHSRRADGAGMRNWTTKLRQPSPTRRMIRPPRWRRRIRVSCCGTL